MKFLVLLKSLSTNIVGTLWFYVLSIRAFFKFISIFTIYVVFGYISSRNMTAIKSAPIQFVGGGLHLLTMKARSAIRLTCLYGSAFYPISMCFRKDDLERFHSRRCFMAIGSRLWSYGLRGGWSHVDYAKWGQVSWEIVAVWRTITSL